MRPAARGVVYVPPGTVHRTTVTGGGLITPSLRCHWYPLPERHRPPHPASAMPVRGGLRLTSRSVATEAIPPSSPVHSGCSGGATPVAATGRSTSSRMHSTRDIAHPVVDDGRLHPYV